jgi:hypothetical protein
MKKMIQTAILILAFLSVFLMIYANEIETTFNLEVFPNPMESYGTVSAFFTDKIPISVVLTDTNDLLLKTIYVGVSEKGQMLIPFDRIDDKGLNLPKGKYWVVLSTNAKYTSTKKLLILK